jgi:hypothetical protein
MYQRPSRLIVPITSIIATTNLSFSESANETNKSTSAFDFIIVAPLSRSSVSASSVALHELRATSPTSTVLLVRSTSAPPLPLQLDSCSTLLCEDGGQLCTVDCGSAALRLDSRTRELHLGNNSSTQQQQQQQHSSARWKDGILLLSRLGDVVLPRARIAAEAASGNRLFLAVTPEDAHKLGSALGVALNPHPVAHVGNSNGNGTNGSSASATVVGGGWSAATAASALADAGVKVKIVTPSPTILANELPRPLALFVERRLRSIGATVLPFSLVEFVAATTGGGEGVATAALTVRGEGVTAVPTLPSPLALHVSRTFDSLSTRVVPSDVIVVSPSAESIPGDVTLAEGLGSRMRSSTPLSTLHAREARFNSIEITADSRFQVNAELGAGMGVFVSGASISWPDSISLRSHISAPANVEHDIASARYAARALGRQAPPLPYNFIPAATYNLPALNITALAIGDCNSKFQTFGFWVPPTTNGNIIVRPNAAVAASRLGVVFYLDIHGGVVGVLFWDARDVVDKEAAVETASSTVLGRRLIEQTSIQPLTGEREMIASVLSVAANTLLCAHSGGSDLVPTTGTIQLIPQWVPPRLIPIRTWPLGFGSAATVNVPDWAKK